MNDAKTIETVTRGFFNSGTITQLIVLIIFIIGAGVFVFSEIQDNKQGGETLEEIKKANSNIEKLLFELIEKQGDIETLTRCVNKAHGEAVEVFDNEFTIILGETLAGAGMIQFPTKLNAAFQKYKKKVADIKDCLIFPEDLK
jgi:hypothetical protein